MKKNKREIIGSVLCILVALILIFIPKTGKLAIYESLISVFLIIGIVICYGVKLYRNKDKIRWNWAKDWYIVLVALLFLAVGTMLAKDVVIDAVNGPKTHELTNVKCEKSQGTNIFMYHVYLVGTDENGEKVRIEIKQKDADRIGTRDRITVTYYEHIKKICDIGD